MWVSELTISRQETEVSGGPLIAGSRSPALSSGECCGFRIQQDLITYFQTTAQEVAKHNEVEDMGIEAVFTLSFGCRAHRECAS